MKSNSRIIIALCVLIIFHLAIIIIWQYANEMPQGRDTSHTLNRTSNLLRLLDHEYRHYYYKQDHSYINNLIFITYEKPTLYYYLGALLYQLFFPLFGFKAVYTFSAICFILTILLCYKIGRLYFDENVGLFAACLCSLMPLNLAVSRQYNLEIATSAFVLAMFYFFLKSVYFKNKKYLILAAIVSGAAMLMKYNSFVFLFAYMTWILFERRISDKKHSLKKIVADFLLFFILFIPICSIYYSDSTVLKRLFTMAVDPDIFWAQLPARFSFYLHGLIFKELGFVLGLFFLASAYFAFKTRAIKAQKILLFCIGLPLFITVLLPKSIGEQLEYAMPILPFIALNISFFILSFKKKVVRYFTICLLIIFLPLQLLSLSFMPKANKPHSFNFLCASGFPPVKSSAHNDLFNDLLSENRGKKITIGLIAEEGALFPTNFETKAHLSKLNWEIISLVTFPEKFKEKLSGFDYIIYTTKNTDYTAENIRHLLKIFGCQNLKGKYIFESSGLYEFSESVFLYRKSV